MATARERLLQALTAIISQPFSEDTKSSLKRLLNSYRVQVKPEATIDKTITARDALADALLKAWQQKNVLEKKEVIALIEPFRMQIKTSLTKQKLALHDAGTLEHHDDTLHKQTRIKETNNRHENAYFRHPLRTSNPDQDNAIAGGPLPKAGGRGECPKCHSAGIVLARAYGGDNYYSCIYCGYQAYTKSGEQTPDTPLAVDLLGKNLHEPEVDNDE